MTKTIEQEFYECFDIPKKDFKECDWQSDCPYSDIPCDDCPYYKVYETKYPQITDSRLLELIILVNQIDNFDEDIVSVKELKENVLSILIKSKSNVVYETVREIMGVE